MMGFWNIRTVPSDIKAALSSGRDPRWIYGLDGNGNELSNSRVSRALCSSSKPLFETAPTDTTGAFGDDTRDGPVQF